MSFRLITFSSRGNPHLLLEGALHMPDGTGRRPAAVICHPHPPGGGAMDNNVVVAVTRALVARGVAALRFNFRGVGRSDGQYDNGRGERDDVAGALDCLLAQPEVDPDRIAVVGYSFGAWVGLAHAQSDPRVAAVAAVSLVAWHTDAEFYRTRARPDLGVEPWHCDPDFLRAFDRPKLLVSGERDPLSPPQSLRDLAACIPPPTELHVVPAADHFWRGCEAEAAERVADFLARVLP